MNKQDKRITLKNGEETNELAIEQIQAWDKFGD